MLGDIFGIIALALMSVTAVLMLLRKKILKRVKNLELVRRIHVAIAAMAGLFLILHVAYFVSYPVTLAVLMGYVSAAIALVVWLTGTAFLERFRDSLYFHGTLSLSAISLMVIHSASAGLNIPFALAEFILVVTTWTVIYKTLVYMGKLKASASIKS